MRLLPALCLPLSLSLLLALPANASIEAAAGWSRQTVPGAKVGVGYLVLKNTGTRARSLLKVASPVADAVEIHQSGIDAEGVARMWPVGKLQLAAGETVQLRPEGRHLMLVGLKAPLQPGSTVPVTFTFEDEAPVTVQLEVRSLAGGSAAPDPHAGHAGHAGH